MTRVLIRDWKVENSHRDTERKAMCRQEVETPLQAKGTRQCQEPAAAGREAGNRLSLRACRRTQFWGPLDFGFLAFRTENNFCYFNSSMGALENEFTAPCGELLRGLPQLQRTTLTEITPFQGQPHAWWWSLWGIQTCHLSLSPRQY